MTGAALGERQKRIEGRESLEAALVDAALLRGASCVVILTDHSCIRYDRGVQESALSLDTRNAARGFSPEKIRRN